MCSQRSNHLAANHAVTAPNIYSMCHCGWGNMPTGAAGGGVSFAYFLAAAFIASAALFTFTESN